VVQIKAVEQALRKASITVVSENDVPRVFAASKIAENILIQEMLLLVVNASLMF